MPKVTYIESNGEEHEIDLPEGWSLMQGATVNGIEEIEGECGGSCGCATCHVYVDEAWIDRLPPKEDLEEDMLECTACDSAPNSRLSCQITVSEALDGLVVKMPEYQS